MEALKARKRNPECCCWIWWIFKIWKSMTPFWSLHWKWYIMNVNSIANTLLTLEELLDYLNSAKIHSGRNETFNFIAQTRASVNQALNLQFVPTLVCNQWFLATLHTGIWKCNKNKKFSSFYKESLYSILWKVTIWSFQCQSL